MWAVLQGQMRLFGPRPERSEIEAEQEHQIPHYRLTHLIRPGPSELCLWRQPREFGEQAQLRSILRS